MKFLIGLNNTYTTIRGQILLMEPLATVNKFYSLILEEHKQHGITSDDGLTIVLHAEMSAFVVKNNIRRPRRNYTPKNFHLKWGKCNKIEHTSKACWAHLKCDHYGLQDHIMDVCRKLHKMSLIINNHYKREHKNISSKVNHVETKTSLTLTAE